VLIGHCLQKEEVAVLAYSLGAFQLPCEGKLRLFRGFTARRSSSLFPHGRRKMGQRKLALGSESALS
jgi:hypothetical protein